MREGKSLYAVIADQAYERIKPSLRWLYSTNAKDIGTMYLAYSLFTGLIGLAFSVLLRIELSAGWCKTGCRLEVLLAKCARGL